MKYLAVAVLLAVMQASPSVPGKAPNNSGSGGKNVKQNSSSQQATASGLVAAAPRIDEDSRKAPDANAQQTIVVSESAPVSKAPKDLWDKAYVVLTGLLVAIGAYGIWMARRTLKAIERQARANEDQLTEIQQSAEKTDRMILLAAEQAKNGRIATEAAKVTADAALQNAQSIVNSERPWLFMVFPKPEAVPRETWVHFSVANRGRTPAEITFFVSEFAFDDPDALPAIPKYKMPNREFAHKRYLAPGDPPLEIYDFDCRVIM
jgi:hypothetical protein